ncbi:hypothetical protein ACFLQY_05775 [Verrucomicrobiota bacterium]
MIHLTLADYLTAPLLIALIFIGASAFYYSLRCSRSRRKARKRIYRCSECGNVYAETRYMPVAKCPRCGETNESIRT